MGLGFGEWLVIALILLLIFGAKKIPQIGAGLGQGIRNFKESISGKEEQNRRIESTRERD
jgi:sec-independent protein translocase protein TatA